MSAIRTPVTFVFADLKRLLAAKKFSTSEEVNAESKAILRLTRNCTIKNVSKNCMRGINDVLLSNASMLNYKIKMSFPMLAYGLFSSTVTMTLPTLQKRCLQQNLKL